MNTTLVSVIIPTFNRCDFAEKAIISVLNQSYFNFELIVVDDGSTDNTKEMVRSFFPHVKYLYQDNRGVSAARNFGVANSLGNYIAFLDSDDQWKRDKLKNQVEYTLKNGFRISQTDEIWIRNGKHLNKRKIHQKIEGYIFKESLHLCLITPSAVLIEKALFNGFDGFDENLIACEDYDLWLKISANEKIGLIPEELVVKYGGHEDQLSSTPALDKYRIMSLINILKGNYSLSENQKSEALSILKKKIEIYRSGALKRKAVEEVFWCDELKLNL